MTIRDEVHRLVDELAEGELSDAHALLEALRTQERAAQSLRQARDRAVDEWQLAAIREGLEYAARDDAEWVSHEDVMAWLHSWGSDDELPPPSARRQE
jgi:predicted transcriptional regulator